MTRTNKEKHTNTQTKRKKIYSMLGLTLDLDDS